MPDSFICLFFNTFICKIVNNFFCKRGDYIELAETFCKNLIYNCNFCCAKKCNSPENIPIYFESGVKNKTISLSGLIAAI